MSTRISEIYQNLLQAIQEAFPAHKRLENVDDLELNKAPLLRLGWGLKIGPGRDSKRDLCPAYTQFRDFTVILVREGAAKDSDMVRREQAKVDLLEDLHLLRKALDPDQNLSGTAISVTYQDDGGPQDIEADGKWYVALEAQVSIEYKQT